MISIVNGMAKFKWLRENVFDGFITSVAQVKYMERQKKRHFNGFQKEFMFSVQRLEVIVLSTPFVTVDHIVSTIYFFSTWFPLVSDAYFRFMVHFIEFV